MQSGTWTLEFNISSEQSQEPFNSVLCIFLEMDNKTVSPVIFLDNCSTNFCYHQGNIVYKEVNIHLTSTFACRVHAACNKHYTYIKVNLHILPVCVLFVTPVPILDVENLK